MLSKAYNEGMLAESYLDNPYEINTEAFNDFERGLTQGLKRNPHKQLRQHHSLNKHQRPHKPSFTAESVPIKKGYDYKQRKEK
ncbi:hypothetical protein [Shewanella waksmanii]|uniref:hypothetical protein n=1 Tax=Shewanella waksmanii TaxID=213783 RepID=UPI00048A54BC|nr:hypothetical protein [Shewanella waksmanii]